MHFKYTSLNSKYIRILKASSIIFLFL